MKPGTYDIEHYQGDVLRRTIILRSTDEFGEPSTPLDLTGCVGKAQFRETRLSVTVSAELTVTILNQTTTPGGLTIYLSPANSVLLTKDEYVWDLQLTWPNTDVLTYLTGYVKVTSEVSR